MKLNDSGSKNFQGIENGLLEKLRQTIGLSQNTYVNPSLTNLSNPRKKLLNILTKVEIFAVKYTKDSMLQKIAFNFGLPHIKKTISQDMSEDEIKEFLKWVYELLEKDFKDIEISKELNNDLNKDLNEKLKQMPRYKELADLL